MRSKAKAIANRAIAEATESLQKAEDANAQVYASAEYGKAKSKFNAARMKMAVGTYEAFLEAKDLASEVKAAADTAKIGKLRSMYAGVALSAFFTLFSLVYMVLALVYYERVPGFLTKLLDDVQYDIQWRLTGILEWLYGALCLVCFVGCFAGPALILEFWRELKKTKDVYRKNIERIRQ